jgi:TonB-dependent starch-binding outer membrane protein SusC
MKKSITIARALHALKKPLIIMKLSMILIVFCSFHSFAGASAQTITLNADNKEIVKVLSAIEKQGDFRFVYNSSLKDLKQKVSVSFNKALIKDVLKQLFTGTNLSYVELENNLVAIRSNNIDVIDVIVTGKITNSNGEPVPGVSVRIKGSTSGTSSTNDGSYSINVPDGATLQFSSVGYENEEVVVGGRTSIDVVLKSAVKLIDQVIVVGYGTSRRKDLTGAVASVTGAELAKQPVLTATQAVQGKVAGVQVTSSGDPNALPVIRIRGIGTMLGGANPLYVVDGVINDDIRNINSSDILSFDVLKDASATAIYGMRAANGVILITTKKGKPGKMVVNYDATVGIKEATRLVNMAGANQYAGYVNEASVYYGSGDSIVKQATLQSGGNTDWYDEVLKKGFFQNHNISLSGGSDKINYFFSAGYLADEGIIRTNKFERFTLRNNNDYKISNAFKISTLISYSKQNVRNVDLGVFNVAYRAAPYVIAKQNGLYGNTSLSNNVGNPLLDQDKNDNSGKGDRFQGNIVGELKPIKWLTLRSSFGVDKNNFRSVSYAYKYANVGPNNVFLTAGSNQVRNISSLSIGESQGNRWVWDNTATLAKKFGDHNVNLLIGTTAEEIKLNGIGGKRLDVPEDKNQWYLNAGSTVGATNFNDGDKSPALTIIIKTNIF